MRTGIAVLALAAAVAAPTAALAEDVIVREPAERHVIVNEPTEQRVIVREPAEQRVVVTRPTETVRRYVVQESRPSVTYERRVVVGDTLPDTLTAYEVPDSDYRYTVVNNHRYIVDSDRRVVDVVE